MAKKYLQLNNGRKLLIKLEEDDDNAISVTGTEEDGTKWYLVSFETDGLLDRYQGIGESSGLSLNKHGMVKRVKNYR